MVTEPPVSETFKFINQMVTYIDVGFEIKKSIILAVFKAFMHNLLYKSLKTGKKVYFQQHPSESSA